MSRQIKSDRCEPIGLFVRARQAGSVPLVGGTLLAVCGVHGCALVDHGNGVFARRLRRSGLGLPVK